MNSNCKQKAYLHGEEKNLEDKIKIASKSREDMSKKEQFEKERLRIKEEKAKKLKEKRIEKSKKEQAIKIIDEIERLRIKEEKSKKI